MFGDADHFLAMVRKDYAPVYRHRSVDFGEFAEHGDEASLAATLVDNDNVEWTALYSLRKEANGDWLDLGLRPREIGKRNLIRTVCTYGTRTIAKAGESPIVWRAPGTRSTVATPALVETARIDAAAVACASSRHSRIGHCSCSA